MNLFLPVIHSRFWPEVLFFAAPGVPAPSGPKREGAAGRGHVLGRGHVAGVVDDAADEQRGDDLLQHPERRPLQQLHKQLDPALRGGWAGRKGREDRESPPWHPQEMA